MVSSAKAASVALDRFAAICDSDDMEPSAGALGNESRGEVALITGDVMHHPCQIPYPDWSASDTDPNQAQASRSNLIERFAESDTMIIGTHFANPVAGRIRRDDTTFRLIPTDN